MVNIPIYTAVSASIIMLLQMALMMMVGLTRQRTNTLIGEGSSEEMLLSIRRHANLTENAPMFLLLLGLGEMIAGSTTFVLSLGIAFVVVRVAHAIGLSLGSEPNPARVIGAFGTLVSGLVAAGYVVYATIGLVVRCCANAPTV